MKPDPSSLVTCRDCRQQYGRWRMRCPSCGTSNDQRVGLADAVAAFHAKDNPTEARIKPPAYVKPVVKQRAADECIFCRQHVKDGMTCTSCQEPLHRRCVNIHMASCREFVASIPTVEPAVAPAPSHLENPSSLADQINQSLKGR